MVQQEDYRKKWEENSMPNQKVGITAYNYNSQCDTNGCSNIARVSLGVKDYSIGAKHNICNECLEAIVHDAPISLVINREDVQKLIEAQIAEITSDIPIEAILYRADVKEYVESIKQSFTDAHITLASLPPIEAPVEPPFILVPLEADDDTAHIEAHTQYEPKAEDVEMVLLKEKSWNEIRAFAKELKIEGYGTMKRDEIELAILGKLKSGDA